MGKTLLELLEAWPTPDKLNPNRQKAGMLKPDPDNRFTNDNKQALDFVKKMPKVYGTDLIRITTETDPHETKKAIKKTADKVGGAIGGRVGAVIGGVASKLAEFHPKFPDDWTKGEDGKPTGMEPSFYKGLINGDYAFGKRYNPYHSNSKTKVGNFLAGNKTPDQAANAIVPALKSAAVGLAIAGIGLGLSKLFSKGKKKGNAGSKPNTPKPKPTSGFRILDKNKRPYFPSTLLINEGVEDGVSYGNYSRLTRADGKIGNIDYLQYSSDEIITNISPTLDYSKIPKTGKDSEHTLSEYYSSVFANNTPQTTNVGNVMVSANMAKNSFPIFARLENIDPVLGGKYTQNKKDNASGRALDNKVQNYSKLVDKDGNAYTFPGEKDDDGFQKDNLIDKSASLSQNYGASPTNLLTIKLAKEDDSQKINSLGDPLDPGGNFFTWSPTDTSYTKNFIVDKKNSIFGSGDKYSNEIKEDNIITENGGLSQNFGANTTNLLKIVKGKNDYTFDIKTDDGSDKLIAPNMHAGKEYSYTNSELKINTLTSNEQSRFISGSIGPDAKLQLGYGDKNVETQIGQQFGDAFISVDIDTKKPEEYKYPFRTIGQKDVVARFNTKAANFSNNIDTIMTNTMDAVVNNEQTYGNSSFAINPYKNSRADVLDAAINAEDSVLKVKIGGINFLSTITNLSDKSAASWDSVKPIGSGVNFYLFNVWERDISFDLKLYAENNTELNQIWKKVNDLTLLTKGKTTNTAKGVFGRVIGLQLGDLISVTGFLSDITMSVDDTTPWDIKPGSQAPMICSISVSFKVVTNGEANYSFYNTLKKY